MKLDISGEQKSTNVINGEELKVKLKSTKYENELSACRIYNANETGLLWHLPTKYYPC